MKPLLRHVLSPRFVRLSPLILHAAILLRWLGACVVYHNEDVLDEPLRFVNLESEMKLRSDEGHC